MAGMAQWQAIVDSNLEQLNGLAKEFRKELENLKKEKYTIKLNIDEEKLNSVIKNLDKMLSNLGQGTGDFKEFQNLSKQLSSIATEVQTLSKAFGSINDSGTSELLSSIKNIDQSLSSLSQHIINVNKDFGNIGKSANDNVSQINEAKKATEGLADATKELANAQKEASNIKSNNGIDFEIQKREEESKRFSASLKEQMEERQNQISSMESSLSNFQSKINSLSIKPDNSHSFDQWKSKIGELNAAVDEYKALLGSLKEQDIISDDDITKVTTLENRIKDLIQTMQKTPTAERGYENVSARKVAEQINSLLKENSAMSKQAKVQIRAYYDEVASGTATRPLKEIYNDALKVIQAEREMGRSGKSFFDAFKDKVWYGAAGQLAGMFGIYDIINVAKDGINVLNQFDDGLTTISYTMDLTKTQLDGLGESVVGMAKDLGTSIDNAMQVSQIYANLNTSAEEIKRLSEPTLILSNLTKFDASTVADDIQAVTQQFDIAAENSMHIADVYDYISKNIAVDYAKGIEGMADGLKVAGSTAQEAGLNFEQTASIIAKAMETTRLEGSQVGNGLKTILTRLSKVGELSGEVDNDTLSKASESLHKIGVEVYNTDGKFRQFDVIIGELADKWDTLSDAEQANISFNIAA